MASRTHSLRAPRRRSVVIGLLVAWLAWIPAARAVTFSAGLDRTTIRLGESAVLTLRYEGGRPDALPRIPAVAGLDINYASQSTQMNLINGQMSSSVVLTYEVRAQRVGDYTIPGFNVTTSGGTLPSQPLVLKVLPADAKTPESDSLARLTFLELKASRTEVFLGEPFLVELHLYFTSGQDFQMPNLRGDGFTFGPMPNFRTQAQRGNTVYSVLIFRTVAVPVKAGKLSIGPVECNFVLHYRAKPDPFDLFGRGIRLQPVSPRSEPVAINVRPLPTNNVPPGFTGAVGSFRMTASALPLEVAAGDPLTVRVQVAGKGAFDNVHMPALPEGPDFRIYPPSVRTEMPDPLTMMGVKTFEQVVLTQNPGIQSLPLIQFSYFDPEAGEYKTIAQPAIPLTIRPGAAAPAQQPTVVMTQTNTAGATPANELVHIKHQLGTVMVAGVSASPHPWLWVAPALSGVAWLALRVRRRRQEQLANNPRLRRRLEVARLLADGLKELQRQAERNESDGFFTTLFRLLQEQLGERLDLPASAITEDVIEERLRPAGLPDASCSSLHALFSECNQARYAPTRGVAELSRLAAQFARLIPELRQLEVVP